LDWYANQRPSGENAEAALLPPEGENAAAFLSMSDRI
jgi:hypothetical protein